jgi:hypothetical protein
VCRHLVSGSGAGFHTAHDEERPDHPWPDAWCDACEGIRRSEDGWTDASEAFAGIQLLCDACYQRARERNWRQDDQAFRRLLADAVAYLQARQRQLPARYRLGSYSRFDWSQQSGHLVFSADGHARVVADIQFVGTLSTASNTWLWSWANPSIIEPVKQRTREVRAYGDVHHYLKLASASFPATEVDGWEMTAIAAYLLEAAGAYRAPDDGGMAFLLMTDVQWAQ